MNWADMTGYGVIGTSVLGFGVFIMSKLSTIMAKDRATEKTAESGSTLLEHYEQRLEDMTKKIDQVIESNSELSKTNGKLIAEISQLILQMRVYSELLMHYTKMAEEGNLPHLLLANLAESMYKASEPFSQERKAN